MKIYRLTLEVGYYKARFDFCNIKNAAALAELILDHQVDDTEKEPSVKISVIKDQVDIIDQE